MNKIFITICIILILYVDKLTEHMVNDSEWIIKSQHPLPTGACITEQTTGQVIEDREYETIEIDTIEKSTVITPLYEQKSPDYDIIEFNMNDKPLFEDIKPPIQESVYNKYPNEVISQIGVYGLFPIKQKELPPYPTILETQVSGLHASNYIDYKDSLRPEYATKKLLPDDNKILYPKYSEVQDIPFPSNYVFN